MSPREKAVRGFAGNIVKRLRDDWPEGHGAHLLEYPIIDKGYPFWAEALDMLLQKGALEGIRIENLCMVFKQKAAWN